MSTACPACGFQTFDEGNYGTFGICDVCGWEDDGVQLANPACWGGANAASLIEAQAAALAEHPLTKMELDGVSRDPLWRPLNPAEIVAAKAEREAKYWKNKAVLDIKDAYWIRGQEC